jgi:hypothetical protein
MHTQHYDEYPRPRSPFSPWLLVAVAGIVLGAATVSAAFGTDSGDFVPRQQAVHGQQAL